MFLTLSVCLITINVTLKYYSNKSYKGIIFNITNDKNKI